MPDKETLERAREDQREGNSPSTQAGEFVREEIHHIREGKHGARSPQQAIAIGLSKARRAGVKLPVPKGSAATREKAEQDNAASRASKRSPRKPSVKRSRGTVAALRRESPSAASHQSLSRQARKAAASRGKRTLKKSAARAARTRKAA
jgi:hypothetical protein